MKFKYRVKQTGTGVDASYYPQYKLGGIWGILLFFVNFRWRTLLHKNEIYYGGTGEHYSLTAAKTIIENHKREMALTAELRDDRKKVKIYKIEEKK